MPALVPGAAGGAGCWCCELAAHVVETGCWCFGSRCWVCAWCMETGCRGGCAHVVETGCRCCWPCACRCWVLAGWLCAVVETGCWVRAVSWLRRWWRHGAGAGWVLGAGPGAGAVSWLYARNIIRCCRLSILCLLALWGIYPLEVCFGRQLCQGLYCLRAYFCTYNVVCATSGSQPTIVSACFSMLQCWILLGLGQVRPTLCRLCAYFCARKLVRARSYWPYRSTDRCFKHATKSIVALDTAWPWANDTYGLCCLRAYFCAHNLFRARSYVVIPYCARRGGDRVPVLGAVAGGL